MNRCVDPKRMMALLATTGLTPIHAFAAEDLPTGAIVPIDEMSALEVIQGAIFLGGLSAALLAAFWLIRIRSGLSAENAKLREQVSDLSARVERQQALIDMGDQAILVWTGSDAKPELIGGLPPHVDVPANRASMLGFGRWLAPESVSALNRAIARLRQRAEAFDLPVTSLSGVALQVEGRTSGARALVRFAIMDDGEAREASLRHDNAELRRLSQAHDALLAEAPFPVWKTDPDGSVIWRNEAYRDLVADNETLLGASLVNRIRQHLASGDTFNEPVTTVLSGNRHRFHVTVRQVAGSGTIGFAVDIGQVEGIQAEMASLAKSHAGTLDLLGTAIAIFDKDTRLTFYNEAFRLLWDLDIPYLDGKPTHELLLDRLRSERKLEEQPKWHEFKSQTLAGYRAVESSETTWHLPDGQTLRVITNPNPQGGITTVFENLTREYTLKSENQTLQRVRSETLDHLVEGVAVFGTDGRLSLHNTAFLNLWNLAPESVVAGAHVRDISKAAAAVSGPNPWPACIAAITGFAEERADLQGRIELKSGTILSYGLVHLPNGQAMLTFVDVTDSVRAERMLQEKNAALEDAATIKSRFVHHVSYALRAPLTSIKGFAEILRLPGKSKLDEAQTEYVGHILHASNVLELMVDDILDLATIDAGIMKLEPVELDIAATLADAAGLVRSRFEDCGIALAMDVAADLPAMEGDPKRIRQIVFNLLDNAANHAPEGSTVTLSVRAEGDRIAVSVADHGPGIPEDQQKLIFARFEHNLRNGRRRGAGLGLSIVESFVKLHGGTVTLRSKPGQGTTFTCTFPLRQTGQAEAAE